jgi:secondary thiamine-phosphate synthase enzyme
MHSITQAVDRFIQCSGIQQGMCLLSCLHKSASLVVQEDASTDVKTDLSVFLDHLAPMEADRYVHQLEGLDDMPAHLKTLLTQTHLCLSIRNGQLNRSLAGIFLLEHRQQECHRLIQVHIIGSD